MNIVYPNQFLFLSHYFIKKKMALTTVNAVVSRYRTAEKYEVGVPQRFSQPRIHIRKRHTRHKSEDISRAMYLPIAGENCSKHINDDNYITQPIKEETDREKRKNFIRSLLSKFIPCCR
ncbi:uncharacterized protein LOC123310643 [Coccinella septempunctata]|uniref:uncharacterized protein LOC123310643 n=1 Tax=Coccinella septempunctata TaxID=41139 RepID=UPI001D068D29|nr:uncharacterized protein LOC123310643 [Coccinella septempunctata]